MKLGSSTTSVPVDQIASIRYDGQTATLQLAETREAAGQLAEAADLFKKAARRVRRQTAGSADGALPRGRGAFSLALAEPARLKDARDELARSCEVYPRSRHLIPAREALARPSF